MRTILGVVASLVLASSGLAFAKASPLTVDAGPAKVIAFPATDLTLFGHATAPDGQPLVVRWTRVRGPAADRKSVV